MLLPPATPLFAALAVPTTGTNVTATWCAQQLTKCLYWDHSTVANDMIARCIANASTGFPPGHWFAQSLGEIRRNANISLHCFDEHHRGGVTFAGGFVPMLNTTPALLPVTTQTFSAYTCGAQAVSRGDILDFCPNSPSWRRKKCRGMPDCNASFVHPGRDHAPGACCNPEPPARHNSTAANFTYPLLAEIIQRTGKVFGDNCKRLFAENVSVAALRYKAPVPSGPPKDGNEDEFGGGSGSGGRSGGMLTAGPTPSHTPSPGPVPIGGWFCGALWAYEHNDTLGGWSLYNQTDTGTPVAARYRFITDTVGSYAGAVYSLVAIHDAPCYQQLIARNNTPQCAELLPQAFVNCSDDPSSDAAALHADQRRVRDEMRSLDAQRAALW